MKKILLVVLAIGIFLGVSYIEHNYTRPDCKVVAINEGRVVFADRLGQCWGWDIEENEHFEIGDKVDLKMHDNLTSGYQADDTIKKVVRAK